MEEGEVFSLANRGLPWRWWGGEEDGGRRWGGGWGGDLCGGELVEKCVEENESLLEKLKELKEKEKGKEMKWEDIFLESELENIERTDTRVYSEDAEIFRENTGIARNSSISERPEIIIKNQEYYTKYHSEIRFQKYCKVLILKIPESVTYRLRKNFHKIIKSPEKEYR